MTPSFPPTRAAALAGLGAMRTQSYASSRNHLDGAVTRLSPYLTHGLLNLPEVAALAAARVGGKLGVSAPASLTRTAE